jgi:hypothetical protein
LPNHPVIFEYEHLESLLVAVSILGSDASFVRHHFRLVLIEQPTVNTDARPEVTSPTITSG